MTNLLAAEASHCLECLSTPTSYQQLYALYHYQPPFDQVLRALKFKRLSYLAEVLAAEAWDLHAERLAAADLVVPVPLAWPRLVSRGFNQAEVLARTLAAKLGLPVLEPLVRLRGPLQSDLEKEADRRRNVARTLHLRRKHRTSAKTLNRLHVVLVDDLVTSGATARRAAQLLRRAGARRVTVVAAGHRPLDCVEARQAPDRRATRRVFPRLE